MTEKEVLAQLNNKALSQLVKRKKTWGWGSALLLATAFAGMTILNILNATLAEPIGQSGSSITLGFISMICVALLAIVLTCIYTFKADEFSKQESTIREEVEK
ncbi:MAG: DUF485 domain-containing protein [Pseudomonadota bacterium]|nr:DUF485 domain-containing protein [Pseudomonadota bacterium]